MNTSAQRAQHRIVIVGGGAGGLELATHLGQRSRAHGAAVVLVDRNATHFWKPRLHEVAVGLIGSGDDEISYLAQGRAHGFEFQMGPLEGLDMARRVIRLGHVKAQAGQDDLLGAREIPFDTLVLAFGSRVNDFGIPGVIEHCHMLDSAAQAQHLQRSFIEGAIQVAAGRIDHLSVGIVGAGATGVELAAELHHAVHAMERYGGLASPGGTNRLEIYVIDRADRVLPSTHPKTSAAAMASLQKLGVQLRLGASVERVTADALYLSGGERVPCGIKVWASGVAGHDVVHQLAGLTVNKGGRIEVDAALACIGVQGVFAMGDCAAAPASADGKALLPPTAQVAHQQAQYLAKALERRLVQKPVKPFQFHSKGTLISLGEGEAAGEVPSFAREDKSYPIRGTLAKLLYVSLFQMHRVALHGWLRAGALFVADRLRGTTLPPVKLH